jgi:hypothetical protein
VREFLAEYAAGTLPPDRQDEVARHLVVCGDCRTELATWVALAGTPAEPPAADMVRRALLRGAMDPPNALMATGPRWRLPATLLRAQAHLIHPLLWIVAALVMALGDVVAYRVAPSSAGPVLALVAPIVAAMCVVGACTPERDKAFELCATTITGPRSVLLARMTLVFGYDLGLALAGSLVLWLLGLRATGLTGLIGAWFGPTALLSALALLASVAVGTEVAAGMAATMWALRLVAAGQLNVSTGWLAPVRTIWTTNAGTVTAATVLLIAAGLLAGRHEPIRTRRPTYLA